MNLPLPTGIFSNFFFLFCFSHIIILLMDFAITGKQIKASTNPLNPSLTTPAKKTSKKLVPKTPQLISKPTPAAVLKVSPPQIKKIPPPKDAPATKK